MTDDVRKPGPPASDRGVYGISIAAELSGINEQSLRLYERQGLLTPARSPGGTRRYSADDLVRLRRISELSAAGVNLAGIARILELEDLNAALDVRNLSLANDNAELRAATTRRRTVKRQATSTADSGSATPALERNPPPVATNTTEGESAE